MQTESHSKPESLSRELEKRIAEGVWGVDERIPIESILAQEFGCSRATVSKAVDRLIQLGLVERRPRLGTRVLRTAPPRAAGLALDACAMIYPSDRHEGIWRTVSGFQDAAREARRRIVTLTTGDDFRKDAEIIGRLAEFDVKGAALFPVLLGPQHRLRFTQMLLACPFPVVLIETLLPDADRPSVAVDGLHAGYTATRHLLAGGARRIGFLANNAWAMTVREKHSGYRQAMFEAGRDEAAAELAWLEPAMRPDFDDPLAESRAIATDYLRAHPGVEAVVCATDFTALALIDAAAKLGRRVPDDLRVTGVDDFQLAHDAPVPLTTYRVPYEKMGRAAFELLDARLQGNGARREVLVRGELVVRQSA